MAKKIRILYIDNDASDRALVKNSLEREQSGFSLMLAKSKEEFEKLIHKHTFDLVLTDFNILGFEGFQVLETMQSVSPGTPVIIVTGTGSEEIAVKALKMGAADYIIKSPQHILRLPNTINTVLEKNSLMQERENDREKLLKMNRVYALISQINQVIVRTSDRDKLFQLSCDIAIEYGKFRMAWIGLADKATGMIKPKCWAGNEDRYLSEIIIKTSGEETQGKGPTGIAFRKGRYFVCNDIEHDPIMKPWKGKALKRGYRSSIGLPIKLKNEIIGVFTIYANEPDFFDNQEIKALEEVTNDISFALETLGAEKVRRHTEEELVKMNRVYALISQINQLIVRNQDRDKLLQEACNIAITYGEFQMAWIGLSEKGDDLITPHCWAGHENGYLSKVDIYQNTGTANGKGPTRSVFAKGDYMVCNDIEHDQIFEPWRDEALKRNFRSSISLPLRQEGEVIGTFNVYAEEPFFFDKQEVDSFKEVVGDLSYALDAIQADKIRRETEKELQAYFEHDISADFLVTADGKLINCNKTFYKMFGIETKIQKEQFNITHLYKKPEERKKLLDRVKKEGKVENYEIDLVKEDGTPLYVLGNILGNFDESGELVSLREYTLDITKRRLAEERSIKLSHAVEQSPEAIVITDKFGKIEYVNTAFTKVTGYSYQEAIGENPKILSTHEKSSKEYEILWKTIFSGKTWRGEFHNKKKNGELYWEQASISPILDEKGEITHFVAVKEDITERKVKDIELQLALGKAQESDKLKSAFLANMSHEIRTPMNGILGFAELLKEPVLNGKQQKEYLDIIEKSANRMLNIITDIVNISKIEAGQMEVYITECSLNEEMNFLYLFFKPETDKKKVKLSFSNGLDDEDSIINTDREKFNSILTNIIKNAVKFTSEGFIEVGYEKKGSFLEFFVKDSGEGIEDKYKEVVFERFRQGSESLSRRHEGSGLGLSISKAYVEMLGGKIWFESKKDDTSGKHGTEFRFLIPYNPVFKKSGKGWKVTEPLNKSQKDKKYNILIVEDDDVSEMLLKYILDPVSKKILHAPTGQKAVEIARQNPDIDVIMMDIRIPLLDGYEATKQIRKFNKDVIIIAQTAFAMEGDREKALESGCNEYITKPIELNKFRTILEKFNLD